MDQYAWRVVGASVCGLSHEKAGLPCQDAHAWRILSDGTLIIAVADGAGSADFANIGATVATQAAIESLFTQLSGDILTSFAGMDDNQCKIILCDAVKASRIAVESAAITHNTLPRELASTLIIVLARQGVLAAAHIGDGAVLASNTSGEISAVTIPRHGEFLNETTFLVSPNALDEAQLTFRRGDFSHIAVMTDGLQMVALQMPSGMPHSPFFAPLFRFFDGQPDEQRANEAISSFLRSPRLRERADDDLTLVLAGPCFDCQ
jgi:Protein phosphatase 2C